LSRERWPKLDQNGERRARGRSVVDMGHARACGVARGAGRVPHAPWWWWESGHGRPGEWWQVARWGQTLHQIDRGGRRADRSSSWAVPGRLEWPCSVVVTPMLHGGLSGRRQRATIVVAAAESSLIFLRKLIYMYTQESACAKWGNTGWGEPFTTHNPTTPSQTP
jgi:hypothetical protein